MDIILWRHAEAEDVNPQESGDPARRLTAKGRGQAKQMAEWLQRHLPAQVCIKVSPARRCVQTAQALERPFEVCPAISTDHDVSSHLHVIDEARRSKHAAVMLVGHQPTLGVLAATLMTGQGTPWAFKRGAVWWLRSRATGSPAELLLALPPRFL